MKNNDSGTKERIDVDYEHGCGKLVVFLRLDESEQQVLWERIEDGHQLPDDAPERILEVLGVEDVLIANHG